MSQVAEFAGVVKGESPDCAKFVWGAEKIGLVIGRNRRQAESLLARKHIKCARRVGGMWVANREALLKEFGAAP
jgi:hypothetical protein